MRDGKKKKLRIGTRDSALAMIQAKRVESLLKKAYPQLELVLVPIKTTGDIDLVSPLHSIGGKGVFIKELEFALLEKKIDLAVHSLKDVTSTLISGLHIPIFLPAEARRDAVILNGYKNFSDLPQNAVIATSSFRRKALLKKLYPHLKTAEIRGNVLSRIDKLKEHGYAALMLSEAGLLRLGLQDKIALCFDPHVFIPAPGQGVIAVELRIDDHESFAYAKVLNDPDQSFIGECENNFLQIVGFDCSLPLGLYSTVDATTFESHCFLANNQMQDFFERRFSCPRDEAKTKIRELAHSCKEWMDSQYRT